MTTPKRGMTRRAALAGLGGLAAGARADATHQPRPEEPPPFEVPIRGKAGPGMEPFDEAIVKIMDRHGVPGAALAIALKGKLVLAKGYGWATLSPVEPVQPDHLFGLASLSKPLTAVATLKLVEQGKLRLDDKVFEILDTIRPPIGGRANPALRAVTVRQCLNHSGGWNREVSGDPIGWEPQICRALRARPPLSPSHFLSFMLTVPLDFTPGTDAKYSNVGYVILGEVVAKVSKQSYQQFVTEHVLKPMGITRMAMTAGDGLYRAREAHRYLAGSLLPLPGLQLPMIAAAGGWAASAVDMMRFMTNLDGSRGQCVLSEKSRAVMLEAPPAPLKPRADGTYFGLGWDIVAVEGKVFEYFKDGVYQGMRTFSKRLPTGVNWALLYNASLDFDSQDAGTVAHAAQDVHKLVAKFDKYPDVDLFKEYD